MKSQCDFDSFRRIMPMCASDDCPKRPGDAPMYPRRRICPACRNVIIPSNFKYLANLTYRIFACNEMKIHVAKLKFYFYRQDPLKYIKILQKLQFVLKYYNNSKNVYEYFLYILMQATVKKPPKFTSTHAEYTYIRRCITVI